MHRHAAAALLALLGTACAAPRALAPPIPPEVAAASPATMTALARARAKTAEAQRLISGFDGNRSLLAQAQDEAARGSYTRAQSLAQEAQSRAELAMDGYYVAASARELQRLYGVTGLSDGQLGKLRDAEVKLVRGEGARAYALLQQLGKELSTSRKHQVASGESLWTISARPEVYANGYLWPLIWDANRDRIKNPDVLQAGQTLRIRPNPTVDEVVQAVETARNRMAAARVRIGKIREQTE